MIKVNLPPSFTRTEHSDTFTILLFLDAKIQFFLKSAPIYNNFNSILFKRKKDMNRKLLTNANKVKNMKMLKLMLFKII